MVTLGKRVICGEFRNEPSVKERKIKKDVNKVLSTSIKNALNYILLPPGVYPIAVKYISYHIRGGLW
jgi:hypothetical protein